MQFVFNVKCGGSVGLFCWEGRQWLKKTSKRRKENICTGGKWHRCLFLYLIIHVKWIACVCANECCQELTGVKLFLFFFPFARSFARAASRAICWHRLAAVKEERNPVAHHPSSVISTSGRFRGREGGKEGCGAGELERVPQGNTRRAKSRSQRTRFQKQSGGVFSLLSSSFPSLSFHSPALQSLLFLNSRHLFFKRVAAPQKPCAAQK